MDILARGRTLNALDLSGIAPRDWTEAKAIANTGSRKLLRRRNCYLLSLCSMSNFAIRLS